MAVVSLVLLLGQVKDSEGHGLHDPVLYIYAGPLDLIPPVHHIGVLVPQKIHSGRVGHAVRQLPAVQAVLGNDVKGLSGAPLVDHAVVQAAAVPEHRVLHVHSGQPLHMGPEIFLLQLKGVQDAAPTESDEAVSVQQLVGPVRPQDDADVGPEEMAPVQLHRHPAHPFSLVQVVRGK